MTQHWPEVPLSELLTRRDQTVVLQPDADYREVTVRLWGNGVVQRRVVKGAEIAATRRTAARAGQFILSRIDARNGALGVVPPELDGAVVTNDFPVFDISTSRLLPAYLGWMCRTAAFVEECARASEGTTNRVRLKEEKFLARAIRLPPLPDQRRVVARIEELAARIQNARAIRSEATEEAEAMVTSVHMTLAGPRTRRLGEVLELAEEAVPVSPVQSYPQVGVRSFGYGLFPKAAVAGSATTYKVFNRLHAGDVVLSQVKGWEGAVAVCPSDLAGWFVSPEYRTFRCIPREARSGYLAALVRTNWFWSRLANATRGVGARRERTRPEQFLQIELPMPDVGQQARGERIFACVEALRPQQAATAAELDALLPAIVEQAFRRGY